MCYRFIIISSSLSENGASAMRTPKEAIDWTRRNHALEHATVTLLLERGVKPPLGGYSVPSGFFIWSSAPADVVDAASREALRLLKAGHSGLAVSPFCGTNWAASVLVGGAAALLAAGGRRGFWASARAAIAAAAAVSVLGKPVGRFLQRRFTTLPDLERVEIESPQTLLDAPTVNVVWIGANHAAESVAPPAQGALPAAPPDASQTGASHAGDESTLS